MQRRVRWASVAAGVGGAALFAWTLRATGIAAVAAAVGRLGIGFAVIVALGGVRHLLRAAAWRLCLESPAALSLATSFAAYVAGDAVGNVTPFGVLISEPSKIVLVHGRIDTGTAIAGLAVENLFYGASVVVMLLAGTAAALCAFAVAPPLRAAGMATVIGAILIAGVTLWILAGRRRVMSAAIARLGRAPDAVRAAEDRVFAFAGRHRARVLPVAILECAYHASAVLEIWIALWLITGVTPAILVAFVLEYVNRTITVVFQFVPMWLGVDEAGTGLMTTALGLTGATGVALALARKARVAVWTAVGFALLGIFRRRPVFTGDQDEDPYRWRERVPGAAAREGARR